jgi:uncharacterized protein
MKVNVFDNSLSSIIGGGESRAAYLRFSRFVHQFQRGDEVALYHSLTHQLVFLEADHWVDLSKHIQEHSECLDSALPIADLVNFGFVVSTAYDEDAILAQIRSNFLGKPIFGILYLLLTAECNLRCRYCFIEGAMARGHTPSAMSTRTALRGLHLFAEALGRNPIVPTIDNPTIIFYGGEPLLNKDAFLTALGETARLKASGKLPATTGVSLITNGTVIEDDVLDAIRVNGVSVAVSLDGPSEVHDGNRVSASGRGTFAKVVANIRRLQDADVHPSVSCTITSRNVDVLREVFQWMIADLGVESLAFNMLIDLPGVSQTGEGYAKRATDGIIACYEIGRDIGIREDRMMRKVRPFVTKSLYLADCGGYGNQIVVAPDGRIGPCHGFVTSTRYWPGHVDDGGFDPSADPVFMEWSRRSPVNIAACRSCCAIGICGGGCAYNADLKLGDIWAVDPNFCVHTKAILEWLIWDVYGHLNRSL